LPEFEDVSVVKGSEGIRRFRRGTQVNPRARAIAELEMPGDKIGVKVSEEDVLDGETCSAAKAM
jgi:hypothetical protein